MTVLNFVPDRRQRLDQYRKVARTVIATVVFAACLDPFAPPANAYRFEPPDEYRAAWATVEECSDLRGTFASVRWYAVPGSSFPCSRGLCSGSWQPPHDIYVAETHAHDAYSQHFVVRHEILHDLIGAPGHPAVFRTCDLWRPTEGEVNP